MKKRTLKNASEGRLPVTFFLLAFTLSSPSWVISATTGWSMLPGSREFARGFFPVIGASILSYIENGVDGVKNLFKRIDHT